MNLFIERETDAMNIKSAPVDAQINFNMDSPASEPKEQNIDVAAHEDTSGAGASMTGPQFRKDFNFAEDSLMKSVFLRQHKDDIVCGPCDLECFVDMPSHTGVVTLTSRELMLSKNRSFLLHICAQDTPGGDGGGAGKGTDGEKGGGKQRGKFGNDQEKSEGIQFKNSHCMNSNNNPKFSLKLILRFENFFP